MPTGCAFYTCSDYGETCKLELIKVVGIYNEFRCSKCCNVTYKERDITSVKKKMILAKQKLKEYSRYRIKLVDPYEGDDY